MKKIWFNLNIGIIGSVEAFKRIFVDTIKELSVKQFELSSEENHHQFLILFDSIPVVLRIFIAKNFDDLVNQYKSVNSIEIVFIIIDLNSSDFLNSLTREKLDIINEIFLNELSFLLVGVNPNKNYASEISDEILVDKAKDLNILYCFKSNSTKNDIIEILDKILRDFTFKYRATSPELFERAKTYGISIKKKIKE